MDYRLLFLGYSFYGWVLIVRGYCKASSLHCGLAVADIVLVFLQYAGLGAYVLI